MINRWMAVVLGAAVLAVPGTAVAKGDHGQGHAKKEKAEHHKSHEHGKKGHKGKKEKAAKKAKKPKNFVFRGVYKGDGVVTVTSGNSWVRKGGYVGTDVTFDLSEAKLKVADTGVGIAAHHLGRIFDALFTTKPRGKGTGLGLTVARDLVTAQGGSLRLASEPGRGTTVEVRLPRADHG